ncbi:MAG: cupredoxin domain-containing protein [Acidimicrobiia bacterium]|nr:cupredoxin domain-containing protein [Acidimicrobiia bacterium]
MELLVAGAGAVLAAGAIAALVTAGGAPAAVAEGGGAPATGAVAIAAFTFTPDPTIRVGETVTWTNEDAFVHTVVAPGDSPVGASDDLAQGGTYAVTFDAAGTYEYVCGIHPNMRGTVTVTT